MNEPQPLLVLALSFSGLCLAAWVGWFLLKKQPLQEEIREDFNVVLASTLSLLGLIIGFSFSVAINRYDQRKNYEAVEANAIGTEYFRLDLLPADDAAKVRPLLRSYLDQRILFHLTRDEQELQKINSRTTQLQTALWSAVRVVAVAKPTPIVSLAVSGMNDVLDAQGYTQAAYWNRIPTSAWWLMVVIAICCNLLVGYGSRSMTAGSRLLLILPLIVSLAFMLIADIDTPRHGFVRISPENLLSLADSLRPR